MAKAPINFVLNGSDTGVFVEGGDNLLNVLRRNVGDLSPKFGCGQGTCGTCTVLIDGQPHLSCLTLAETVQGRSVETTNGLANGPDLHPLQIEFMEGFAAQCGFCTPGMVMTAAALMKENPTPTEAEIRAYLEGNICRCTGYHNIVASIADASTKM